MSLSARRGVRHAPWLLAAITAIALVSSCSGQTKQAGGLELILQTDLPTPATFDTVNVDIEQQTASGWHLLDRRGYVIPTEMTLPTSIALRAGTSPYQEVLITVTGLSGNPPQPLVQRIVQTQVPTDRVDEVLLVLSSKCVGKLSCPVAGDSCQPDVGTCGPNSASVIRPFNASDLSDAGVATTVGEDGGAAGAEGAADARVCTESSTQCSPNGGVQTCVNGAWLAPVPCASHACTMGACSGSCQAGTSQCSGNGVQKCDSTGHLAAPVACANQACVAGACQGVCSPGATQCSAGGVQTCDTTGAWGMAMPCGVHQTCAGGTGGSAAACTCTTDPACGTGAAGAVCAGGSTIAACAQDAQGCYYAASSSPCTNGACFGSPGSAQCCTNGCTANATQCGGAGLQTCQVQGNGCTAWNAGTACGTHQHCTGSAGAAACVCSTDPNCTSTTTVCANTSTSATCAMDAQGCYYTSATTPCGTNEMCQGGSCSCSSGFTPCGTSCVNVNTDKNNCGACNHVCPVAASPSSPTTCTGTCQISLGGYVSAGGNPLALDPNDGTSYWVQAKTPNAAGTFVGVGATVGSKDPSGTTPFILGLYSDSGGNPGSLLFNTDYSNPAMAIANPSSPVALTSLPAGGSYQTGFTGALTANTTYWVYIHAGTGSAMMPTAAASTSPCVGGQWINVDPPGMWSYTTPMTCPGDIDAYLIATFP